MGGPHPIRRRCQDERLRFSKGEEILTESPVCRFWTPDGDIKSFQSLQLTGQLYRFQTCQTSQLTVPADSLKSLFSLSIPTSPPSPTLVLFFWRTLKQRFKCRPSDTKLLPHPLPPGFSNERRRVHTVSEAPLWGRSVSASSGSWLETQSSASLSQKQPFNKIPGGWKPLQ